MRHPSSTKVQIKIKGLIFIMAHHIFSDFIKFYSWSRRAVMAFYFWTHLVIGGSWETLGLTGGACSELYPTWPCPDRVSTARDLPDVKHWTLIRYSNSPSSSPKLEGRYRNEKPAYAGFLSWAVLEPGRFHRTLTTSTLGLVGAP